MAMIAVITDMTAEPSEPNSSIIAKTPLHKALMPEKGSEGSDGSGMNWTNCQSNRAESGKLATWIGQNFLQICAI
jgi:hypothetical protein